MYIKRQFEGVVLGEFQKKSKGGLILSGVVGCGKTTLVAECLRRLGPRMQVFEFTGDDVQFRAQVARNTRFLLEHVQSRTQNLERSLIFVDEIQKSEAVFDAIKIAYDAGVSFLVTGSNPHYLNTVGRKRLQRRARDLALFPFSIPEILEHRNLIPLGLSGVFASLLVEMKAPELPSTSVERGTELVQCIERYLSIGGLPLAHLAETNESLVEIRKTVERGFEPFLLDTRDMREIILVELAQVHSQEFTYRHIFKKTGLRRREQINSVIEQLKAHGYLLAKKPFFFDHAHRSYLTVYSYIDPGIVSYLSGESDIHETIGQRIEGVVHTRLTSLCQEVCVKTELGYYKTYQIETDGELKFLKGEVDFIFRVGKRIIPIEVKASSQLGAIDAKIITQLVEAHKLPFGIVLYGGVPYLDRKRKLIFWPWWGI